MLWQEDFTQALRDDIIKLENYAAESNPIFATDWIVRAFTKTNKEKNAAFAKTTRTFVEAMDSSSQQLNLNVSIAELFKGRLTKYRDATE